MVMIPISSLATALATMTDMDISALSTAAIASLSASDLATLLPSVFYNFSVDQIAAINSATLSALDPGTFSQFNRNNIRDLTTTQLTSLTLPEVATLTTGKLATLSAAQIAAIDPTAIAVLGPFRIGSLSAAQIEGLTTVQLGSLTIPELSALGAQATVLTTSGGNISAMANALSTTAIASLNASELATLPPSVFYNFSVDQIAAINSATLSALDPGTFSQFNRNNIRDLTTTQLTSLTLPEVATLTTGKLATLSAAQIAAIDPTAIAVLGPFRIGSLSAAQIEGLTTVQLGSLTISELSALGAQATVLPTSGGNISAMANALSTTAIASLNASELTTLPPSVFYNFSVDQIAAINSATLSALDPGTFSQFSRSNIQDLTTTQIASLTLPEVATLTTGKLATLSAAQIAAIDPTAIAVLGPFRIGSLSAAQIEGLTTAQLGSLNIPELSALAAQAIVLPAWGETQVALLETNDIASMSVITFNKLIGNNVDVLSSLSGVSLADFNSLTSTQFSTIDSKKLNALSGNFLSQINPIQFSATQFGGLQSNVLSTLTTTFFSALPSADLTAITTSNIDFLTVPDLLALNTSQLSSFSQSQISAMSFDQIEVYNNGFDPLIVQAQNLMDNGILGVGGVLSLLQNVVYNGATNTTFTELLTLGNALQTSSDDQLSQLDDSILTTAAAKNLFDNVVFGNFENALWNGGLSYAVALGNLSPSTGVLQFDRLIDKWFMGSDLPSLYTNTTGAVLPANYAVNYSPLYDASGTPALTDVLGGSLMDSALLAGIAETALQDPTYLQSLITNDGNGSYQIELPFVFGSSFVTVNNELPTESSGPAMASANSTTGLWTALLEKAAAQNAMNSDMDYGYNSDVSLWNSYAALTVNNDDQIMLFSGQFYNSDSFLSSDSQGALHQILQNAADAFNSNNNVVFEDGGRFYAVTGVDVTNGLVSLYNPMNGQASTTSLLSMATNDDILYYGTAPRASI